MASNPVTGRPMEGIDSVFGGEKNTPHSMMQRAQRENPHPGTAAQAENDIALACPTCRGEGNPQSRMFTRVGAGYYCRKGHKWLDMDELKNLDPEKLPYVGRPARQEGFTKVTLDVPGSVAEALQAKYKDRLGATLGGILDVISDQKFIIVGEEDLKRMADRLGEEVKSPAFLVGKIFEIKQKTLEQEETITRIRQSSTSRGPQPFRLNDTAMIIDFGDELYPKIVQKAEQRGCTPEEYVTNALQLGVEGDWV